MKNKEQNVCWAVTPEKVKSVVQQVIEVGKPEKIFLFGSYVRGKLNENSDLDLLVVSGNNVENTRKESVRIRRALKKVSMPMDIIVVRKKSFAELSSVPGLIYNEVLNNGEMVYETK